MAIKKLSIKIEGVDFYQIISDQGMKIQCNEDGNIYQTAYVTLDSTRTFTETTIPIDQVHTYTADDIAGLSAYVLRTIKNNNEFVQDVLDGLQDDTQNINGGQSD